MSRHPILRGGCLAALLAVWFCVGRPVNACTIGEVAAIELPFNTVELSMENRRAIAEAVEEANKWPDVQIQAIVMAGAYIGEHDLDVLQERRGENVQAYLRKLGIRSENIYIVPKTLTDGFVVKRADGELAVRQVEVELHPICKDSCAWMCDDPRVTPRTKVINPSAHD
ncbi:hypothetical protein QFZ99_005141 [Paraburkholderia atlantica]|uniref:hypothetical protein n=1 Tax=Paraburkholderia atlantica TaxID=2654982 RepID=UPI003D19E3C7